jgi:Protein of unknown function (DUF3093)
MRSYTERLWVPTAWWLLGMLTAFMFASFTWAGFSVLVAIGSYVVFCGGTAAVLLLSGSTGIEVSGGELRAGKTVLPLGVAGQVVALDEAQSRLLRGPRGDPEAFMLFRPYLKRAVYIEVTGEHQDRPYWLIGTRRPTELAAAIEGSRPQARTGGTQVG